MAPVSRYSHQVKEAAFSLCCQNLSAAKIARRIPEIFGDDVRPDPLTVKCWIQKGDWLARRKRVHRKTEVLAEQQLARTTAKLLAGLSYLREKILSVSTSLEFKSAEGVVRSLATLQRVIEGLALPKEGAIGKEQLEAVVGTIFQVLQQDKVLGPVLAKRQADILARIEAQLSKGLAEEK